MTFARRIFPQMNDKTLLYKIAITLIPGIGDATAKKLIAYCGGVEEVFKQKQKLMEKIPGIGVVTAKAVAQQNILERAEEELKFIEKHKIKTLFFTEKEYSNRLKNCNDSPVLLYYKGDFDFNSTKIISVVGTRNATTYGKELCEKIIADLSAQDVIIVSGLAYGIDICAHKAALNNNLKTVAVLGHGLDKIYPDIHRETAKEILQNGALLTEFTSKTKPERENFPKRNRIVAGMADAVLVVESSISGGSLITAEIANSYSRDVFAIPGRANDKYSEGCNWLISRNKAALVTSAKEISYLMGWENNNETKKQVQRQLFIELNPDEKILADILAENGPINIDNISFRTKMSMSKVALTLLNLEFSGIVSSLPGKIYKLN